MCRHGRACYGIKNNKCPFEHPVLTPEKRMCNHGNACHGIKNKKCPYEHPNI